MRGRGGEGVGVPPRGLPGVRGVRYVAHFSSARSRTQYRGGGQGDTNAAKHSQQDYCPPFQTSIKRATDVPQRYKWYQNIRLSTKNKFLSRQKSQSGPFTNSPMLYVVCSIYIQLYVLSPFSNVYKTGYRRPTKVQLVPKHSSVNEEQVHESRSVTKWAVYEQPLALCCMQ